MWICKLLDGHNLDAIQMAYDNQYASRSAKTIQFEHFRDEINPLLLINAGDILHRGALAQNIFSTGPTDRAFTLTVLILL